MPRTYGSDRPAGLSRSVRSAYGEFCRWPDCGQPRFEEPDSPPLCLKHLIHCAKYMSDLMKTSILGPDREARTAFVERTEYAAHAETGSVVYYVRLGDHVKIGTTTNLGQRMAALYVDHDADAILATEPGSRALEQTRHSQFSAERVYANRELFHPSPRLLAHIDALRQTA